MTAAPAACRLVVKLACRSAGLPPAEQSFAETRVARHGAVVATVALPCTGRPGWAARWGLLKIWEFPARGRIRGVLSDSAWRHIGSRVEVAVGRPDWAVWRPPEVTGSALCRCSPRGMAESGGGVLREYLWRRPRRCGQSDTRGQCRGAAAAPMQEPGWMHRWRRRGRFRRRFLRRPCGARADAASASTMATRAATCMARVMERYGALDRHRSGYPMHRPCFTGGFRRRF